MKTAYRYYIHHDYEYVYYAVPKVCTRTILEWLLNNKCINFDKLILSSTGNYYPAPYYRPRLPKEHQTYFTFAFCRNPFDRLVSLYFNKVIGEKSKHRLTLRLNTTNHKHYSEYYDKSLAQKVHKKYHQDFERFGYTF